MPRNSEFVFTSTDGRRAGQQIGRDAFKDTLKALAVNATPHGFRSSFRDWAAERTNFPPEIAETALAHAVGNKVERAYRRGDLFDKRRRLMTAWADFCTKPAVSGATVSPIRAR
jgi:integrase